MIHQNLKMSNFHCPACKRDYKILKNFNHHDCVINGKIMAYDPDQPKLLGFCELPHLLQFEIIKHLKSYDQLSCFQAGLPGYDASWDWYWKPRYLEKFKPFRKYIFGSWGLAYLKKTNNLCFDCRAPTTRVDYFYGLPICKRCRDLSESYQLITKSRAKSEYKLKDKDLADLLHMETTNPHFKSASSMILYLKDDVVWLAQQKAIKQIK